jgi:hypothetical protein
MTSAIKVFMPGGVELTVFLGVVYDTPAPCADRELADILWRDSFVVYYHTAWTGTQS